MFRIRLTAKRQATLPVALCEELGLSPGDTIVLERREVAGDAAWVLSSSRPNWSWAASLESYGAGKGHGWEEIEKSIARGLAGGDRP